VLDPGPYTLSTGPQLSSGLAPRRASFRIGVAGAVAAQLGHPASRGRPGPYVGVPHSVRIPPPEGDTTCTLAICTVFTRTSRRRYGLTELPREAGPDRRLRQGENPVSRERRSPYSDAATADFARGVAAPEMSPGFGAILPPPKGLQHASRPRQAQSSDSRSVAALEQAPGLRIHTVPPEGGPLASRRHDRRDSRTRSGLYQGCPRHVGSVTLPPERGAARIRTPTTGVTLALGVAAPELPPVHRICPAPPRRTTRHAS